MMIKSSLLPKQIMKHIKKVFIARAIFLFVTVFLSVQGLSSGRVYATLQESPMTKEEAAISNRIRHLRELPDDVRATTTKQLALDIRRLTTAPHRLDLAFG